MAEAVLLDQAKKKMIQLRNTGAAGWRITHFMVGDGNGATYQPTADMTDLKHKVPITEEEGEAPVYLKPIESSELASDGYSYIYVCRLLETECAGYSLREVGLVDSDGMLLCIKTFAAKQKDSDREMFFKLSDTF